MDSAEHQPRIVARFTSFDQDGNGYISREDFSTAAAAVLAEFGVAARSEKGQILYAGAEGFWQGMAGMADRDGDQRITRAEFVHGAVKRLRDNPERFAGIAGSFLGGVFAVADIDGDGSMTRAEAVRVLKALGVAEDASAVAVDWLDKDGDGRISEHEATQAFAHYFTVSD
ncbi:EF-hand domain-containing protein [Streptomyces tsukubensis]|uniref:Calcium-binding protein n=1 Tax=Streptomyces tsukubensis TaxID=83656 RepID=A0A1V4A0V0_9ACTN|nr:EF-hand domain-containing protein [Streptomyces tsukubensis]OON72236.1 calcium-binding protein [Streptomyces tsukubensis]QFR94132.1 EF-hand domain-containing protein [Streptomyces tsukubensis]